MNKHRLLLLLLTIIPFCDRAIPDELYWECIAEGIDPEMIYDCIDAGDTETLTILLYETQSEDLLDNGAEDLFRLEVLKDLEADGIEYEDGNFFVQAEIHNS